MTRMLNWKLSIFGGLWCVMLSPSLACLPASAWNPPQERLFIAALDASVGSTSDTRRCDELRARLLDETRHGGAFRVLVLRSGGGGANDSPIVLSYSAFEIVRTGFADPAQVEAHKVGFVDRVVTQCRDNFRVERTSPIRAMLRSALQNAAAVEDEAKRRGTTVTTTIFLASDLRVS